MRFFSLIAILVIAANSSLANSDSNFVSKDHFSTVVEYDSGFQTILISSWSRDLTEQMSISGQFEIFANFNTMGTAFRWKYKWPLFNLGLGLGTTYGLGSFGFQTNIYPQRAKFFIGRELVPNLSLSFANSWLSFSLSSNLYIPFQENHQTAIWVWYATSIIAIKHSNWTVGPFFEPLFVKEGQASMEAAQLRVGGMIEKSFDLVSFSLFLGYDPYERASYLGHPKQPGYIARGAAVYSF